MSGLLPMDYAELDRTMRELDELHARPVITATAWGESHLVRAPRQQRPTSIDFAPGRDVSSAPFPTATSLAPDPVLLAERIHSICPVPVLAELASNKSSNAGRDTDTREARESTRETIHACSDTCRTLAAGQFICPFCAWERAAGRLGPAAAPRGLVRVQSCERHACREGGAAATALPGFPSEVSCPADSPLTPAGAVDSRRPLPPAVGDSSKPKEAA